MHVVRSGVMLSCGKALPLWRYPVVVVVSEGYDIFDVSGVGKLVIFFLRWVGQGS